MERYYIVFGIRERSEVLRDVVNFRLTEMCSWYKEMSVPSESFWTVSDWKSNVQCQILRRIVPDNQGPNKRQQQPGHLQQLLYISRTDVIAALPSDKQATCGIL